MKTLIMKTAWPMTPPAPYSLFHICFTAAGMAAAVFLAYYLSQKFLASGEKGQKWAMKLLFACGLVLSASELYKQFFLYYTINGETYDWWYFPFQLCSVPMYFCLILPFLPSKKAQTTVCTFMQDFNLLGGIMALAEPSGLMHPYWVLTIHGMAWHILLIFIGLFISYCNLADRSLKGFVKTLPLFGICCIVASVINVTVLPKGQADMFYISPYYPTGQIVFHQISMALGTFAGNVIYLIAICLGGLLFHVILSRLTAQKPNSSLL